MFSIPPGVPFLDSIAADWLRRAGPDPLEVARGLILLPTRRAARALAEAFLRASHGRPLLLPRITAFGALDEAPLALAGALDLPPAVEPARRLAALTRLILEMRGANGAPRTADRAWPLAAELAALMDEAERAEIDLAERLPDAVDPDYAGHWAQTLEFLHIVTRHWPQWLADQGMMNPAARLVALLNAQAATWETSPPVDRVLAAGTTGAIPAVARLLKVVAGLPNSAVVLPGLDTTMSEHAWAALDNGHPQAALAGLLHGLGATRDDVRPWVVAAADRAATLSRALLPASALSDWRRMAPPAIDGLALLTAADEQEEAAAIALVLREALEGPEATAALVTPDRDLAGRVATELLRYGVVADDSAGEPLRDSPPAVFLRLVAQAMAEELAPVALLAVLKHPLCAAGLSPAVCRAAARALELACLRGPRPRHGLTGLRRALDRARPEPAAADLLRRIERCLEPLLRIDSAIEVEPSLAFAALVEAAERLAASDEPAGAGSAVGWGRRRSAGHPTGRASGGALTASGPATRRAAWPAGRRARRRRRTQPTRAARSRRRRASARLHLGPAGGAAAKRGRDGARGPRRRCVAASERSRRLALAADARQNRAAVTGRDRRAVGARLRLVRDRRTQRGAVLSKAAGRGAGRAGTLADAPGDVPRRTWHGAATAPRLHLGADARPAGGWAAAGASPAAPAARPAAAPAAVGHRGRDLAARPLCDLCEARPAIGKAPAIGRGDRCRGLRQSGAQGAAPVPGTARTCLAGGRGGSVATGHGPRSGRGRLARGARRLVGAAAGTDRRLGGPGRGGAACRVPSGRAWSQRQAVLWSWRGPADCSD